MKKEHEKTRSLLQNASRHLYLKVIPGIISVEAPSSRLNCPGILPPHHICTIKTHAYEK